MTKNLLLGIAAAVCGSTFQAVACTGISLTSRDGSYVQARTIEWARGVLQSEYVIIPRDRQLTSFTPTGVNGLTFTAKYGVVGLAVVQKEFIAEGKRWFDLLRLARIDHFSKFKTMVVNILLKNISLNERPIYQTKLSKEGSFYFPIHKDEIDMSGGLLIQNAAYQ